MSRIKNFFEGVGFIMKGFSFLASRPRLWPLALLPTIINLSLLAVVLFLFAHYYGDIYGWFSAHLGHLDIENPSAWYSYILDALLWVLDLLFQLLLILFSLIILLISAYAASFIVAAPFNDALSERVETIATGSEPLPFSLKKFIRDIVRTVRIETVKALVLLTIPAIFFVLNLIPVIGGLLYLVLTCLFGAWDMGLAFADLPMGRRVRPLRERMAFARRHKWALIGFGSGFIIPFFSLVFAAPMVVGGTLLYLERQHARTAAG